MVDNAGTASVWVWRKLLLAGCCRSNSYVRTANWLSDTNPVFSVENSSGIEMLDFREFVDKEYTPPITPPYSDDRRPRLLPTKLKPWLVRPVLQPHEMRARMQQEAEELAAQQQEEMGVREMRPGETEIQMGGPNLPRLPPLEELNIQERPLNAVEIEVGRAPDVSPSELDVQKKQQNKVEDQPRRAPDIPKLQLDDLDARQRQEPNVQQLEQPLELNVEQLQQSAETFFYRRHQPNVPQVQQDQPGDVQGRAPVPVEKPQGGITKEWLDYATSFLKTGDDK